MIYTRTGDHGTTDLANGERCKKTDDRMEAVGALDELNAHLGLLLCQLSPEISDKLKTETALILRTQRILFAIGAQAVAAPNSANQPTDEDIKALEKTMDAMVQDHELRFDGFRIPGGCTAAALSVQRGGSAKKPFRLVPSSFSTVFPTFSTSFRGKSTHSRGQKKRKCENTKLFL